MKTLSVHPGSHARSLLPLLLGLALVRGLLYLVVAPAWQHYDEPSHFEYVRLIASREAGSRLPQPGNYDLALRREIAAAMQAAGFWKDLGSTALDLWSETPPSIGVSQLEHPPLYYLLLALPQRLVAQQSVEVQLALARFCSVLFYLVIVAAAYGLAGELYAHRPLMPVAIASLVLFLPPLTDLASAVTNDVGAAAAVSAFLWAAARLLRWEGAGAGVEADAKRGRWLRLLALGFLTVCCLAAKITAGVVAVAALLALGASYLPRAYRRWLGWAGALAVLLFVAAAFTWGGHAAYWLSRERPASANRAQSGAMLGRAALALAAGGEPHPRMLVQELPLLEGQALRGHQVTVGLWLRAEVGDGGSVLLQLSDGRLATTHKVQAIADWQFHAFTATVSTTAPGVAVYALLPDEPGAARRLFLDGVVLVDGVIAASSPPEYDSALGLAGEWGSQRFVNLLRNGSGEKAWPGLRPWIGNRHLYHNPVAGIFHSIWDWRRTRWVYGPEMVSLLHSFWGTFAWNQVRLPVAWFYPLWAFTVLGLAGAGAGWLRRIRRVSSGGRQRQWRRQAWAVLGVAALVAWLGAILRIHPVQVTTQIYWPVARYATVAIAPTAMFLCMGWRELLPTRWAKEIAWLGLLGLIALDALALWAAIVPYHYG